MANITKIRNLAKNQGVKLSFLCAQLGHGRTYLLDVERGRNTMPEGSLAIIAEILHTTPEYLTDQTDNPTPPEKQKTAPAKANAEIEHNDIFMIPVYDSVSAGFGAYADDYITDYMPMQFTSPREAEESIFVTVRGDSMYPKIEDGDTILVHKQESVEQGSIAVVLVGEEALVKRVFCYDSRVELHSINPMYPPQKYSGTDAAKVSVLGLVKKIIKNA